MPALAVAAPIAAEYEVHAAGMTVMRIHAIFDLEAPHAAYTVTTRVRMSGLVGVFRGGDQVTSTEGQWEGARALPRRFRTSGTWRGEPREVEMEYASGSTPMLRSLVPANTDREPVPFDMQRGTMDGLSAMAMLTRTVRATGRCDGEAQVFDGRRRATYRSQTIGQDQVLLTGGQRTGALRCAIESRLLVGRRRDQDPQDARRPEAVAAWFASIGPGGTVLPVKVELPSRWYGSVRVTLVKVEPAAPGSTLQQVAEQRR